MYKPYENIVPIKPHKYYAQLNGDKLIFWRDDENGGLDESDIRFLCEKYLESGADFIKEAKNKNE